MRRTIHLLGSLIFVIACSTDRQAASDAAVATGDMTLHDAQTPDGGNATDSATPVVDGGPVTDPALHTEAEVCARWNADRADNTDDVWMGSGDPVCDPSDMSAAWRSRVLKQVNLFRWVAGLPPVTFEDSRNQKAQDCALIEDELPAGLTHTPAMSAACWTADGYEAAMHSNIAPSPAAISIDRYMVDQGASNALSLGHRRWILDNSVGPFGIGSTASASCLWVIGGSGGADYDYVSWPPPGPVPLEAFYISNFGSGRDLGLKDTAWSVQSETISFAGAVGTISEGGVTLATTSRVLDSNYGTAHAFAIAPQGWDVDPGHTYHVQITGITPAIVYDVEVVSCGTTIGMDL